MADELTFRDEAAAEYDRAFAHVTEVPLNAAALPLVRRWPRCPRRYAAPYAKRCGATSLTLAGQSRRKRSTGSLVAGASLVLATPRLGALDRRQR